MVLCSMCTRSWLAYLRRHVGFRLRHVTVSAGGLYIWNLRGHLIGEKIKLYWILRVTPQFPLNIPPTRSTSPQRPSASALDTRPPVRPGIPGVTNRGSN